MQKHLMLDIETFGDTSNSVIVSIGAIKFDMKSGYTNNFMKELILIRV